MIENNKTVTLRKKDIEDLIECLYSAMQADEDKYNILIEQKEQRLANLVKKDLELKVKSYNIFKELLFDLYVENSGDADLSSIFEKFMERLDTKVVLKPLEEKNHSFKEEHFNVEEMKKDSRIEMPKDEEDEKEVDA